MSKSKSDLESYQFHCDSRKIIKSIDFVYFETNSHSIIYLFFYFGI